MNPSINQSIDQWTNLGREPATDMGFVWIYGVVTSDLQCFQCVCFSHVFFQSVGCSKAALLGGFGKAKPQPITFQWPAFWPGFFTTSLPSLTHSFYTILSTQFCLQTQTFVYKMPPVFMVTSLPTGQTTPAAEPPPRGLNGWVKHTFLAPRFYVGEYLSSKNIKLSHKKKQTWKHYLAWYKIQLRRFLGENLFFFQNSKRFYNVALHVKYGLMSGRSWLIFTPKNHEADRKESVRKLRFASKFLCWMVGMWSCMGLRYQPNISELWFCKKSCMACFVWNSLARVYWPPLQQNRSGVQTIRLVLM